MEDVMGFLIASSGRWRSHTRRAGYGQRSLRPKDSPLGSATKRRSTCAREDRRMIWTNGHTVDIAEDHSARGHPGWRVRVTRWPRHRAGHPPLGKL